jgi:hypothetical protein
MSIRMDKGEARRLAELAKALKKDKSAVARDLMDQGWIFYWINRYRQGKVSLGVLSGKLGLPYSDLIDLLAELKVEAPIDFSDYLAGVGLLSEGGRLK